MLLLVLDSHKAVATTGVTRRPRGREALVWIQGFSASLRIGRTVARGGTVLPAVPSFATLAATLRIGTLTATGTITLPQVERTVQPKPAPIHQPGTATPEGSALRMTTGTLEAHTGSLVYASPVGVSLSLGRFLLSAGATREAHGTTLHLTAHTLTGRGIQNPTDEELTMLLLMLDQ